MNLYLDAVGGVAGDMLISSLLATEIVTVEDFKKAMEGLSIKSEFRLDITNKVKNSVGGLHTNVVHSEGHHHRHLSNVVDIILASDLSEVVKEDAIGVFTKLAEAEAKVHQSTIESVHFHEVGAIDSIVDIVGVCLLLNLMDVEKIYCSSLPVSDGFVKAAHGQMPLPAPATFELLKGMTTHYVDCKKETITPTGAAILAHFKPSFQKPNMEISAIGTGCGTMDFDYPNIIRVILFTEEDNKIGNDILKEELCLLSTNIDDMTPEELAYGVNIIRNYALDVDVEPIVMKKERLAFKLNVLCKMDMKTIVLKTMFRETSTVGIKEAIIVRHSLKRELVETKTNYGTMVYKRAYMGGEFLKEKAEFDLRADCAKGNSKSILDLRL